MSDSRHFLIGPKIEISFDNPFSIEINAIHREIRSRIQTLASPLFENPEDLHNEYTSKQVHTTWQFPVLAKYRFQVHKIHPFVAAGPSFRPTGTMSGLKNFGFTAGAGLNLPVKSFNISPTIRYTRWAPANESTPIFESNLNQVEFLVGFDQSSESGWPSAFGIKPRIGGVLGVGLKSDLDLPTWLGTRSHGNLQGGVMFEADLTEKYSVEVNAIRRTLHFGGRPDVVITWQFPILFKYRLPVPKLNPFLQAGPSFRASGNQNGTFPSKFGFTAGIGFEQHWKSLRFAPALRYTRWKRDVMPPELRPHVWQRLTTVPDQLELVVGITLGPRK